MVRRLFIDPLTTDELDTITSAANKVLAALDDDRIRDVHHDDHVDNIQRDQERLRG